MRVVLSQSCNPYPPGSSWKCLDQGCYHCHNCRGLEVLRLAAHSWARDRWEEDLDPGEASPFSPLWKSVLSWGVLVILTL